MAGAIYLVLDMINDLVHSDSPIASSPYGTNVRMRDVVAKTTVAVHKARAAGIKVGFVRFGFSEDYRECPTNSPAFSRLPAAGLFKLASWGTQVHADIAPLKSEFDFVKHRVSPFYGTNLDLVLRTRDIGRIYCSGVSTNAVVQSTVREGHDRDYEVIVIEDCCSAMSPAEHATAIESFGSFARITTSADVSFNQS